MKKVILTQKDYVFIKEFMKHHYIPVGKGFHIMFEFFLNEYKKSININYHGGLMDKHKHKLGKIFMKDHSTVIHGCQTIEKLIETNQSISNDVFNITKMIIDK